MDFLSSMHASATGLTAGRTQMNIVSSNLANASTTRTAQGGPYQRKFMVLASEPVDEYKSSSLGDGDQVHGVKVVEVATDSTPFPMAHIPGHPDADSEGNVRLPNVNVITEMANMIMAKRAYDANAAALSNTKAMALKALEIGR